MFVGAHVLLGAALVSAACTGALLSAKFLQYRRRALICGRSQKQFVKPRRAVAGLSALDEKMIETMVKQSHLVRCSSSSVFRRLPCPGFVARWFDAHVVKAGLSTSEVLAQGFWQSSCYLAGAGMLLGACAGAVFSLQLAVFLACLGGAGGFAAPFRTLLRLQKRRAASLLRDLSQMLEVLALALRSGLSFDRGFQLYCNHFTSSFALSCQAAQQSWTCGLVSREAALRTLAASYASMPLDRAVESMIRGLRFGSSLVEVLEQLAFDARQLHRAQVQEQVAKAPVKMMLPTGVLILPAMLLLVLGPVLLELAQGF